MSDKSAAELEREAEEARSRVADTAERLRDKMSPGQMVDEFANYFRNSDGSLALDNLKAQVRDNPLSLALIGTGLAWLFMGGGPTTSDLRHRASRYRDDLYPDSDAYPRGSNDLYGTGHAYGDTGEPFPAPTSGFEPGAAGDYEFGTGGSAGGQRSVFARAGEAISDAASSGYDAVGDALAGARDTVTGAGERIAGVGHRAAGAASGSAASASQAGRRMAHATGRAGRQVQNSFLDIVEKEPLVLGAIGVAVGTAIGTMLPRTRFEDSNLGPYREKLREEAEQRLSEGVEQAKDVASSAFSAMKEEADKQGLMSDDGKPLSERIADVGKAGYNKAAGEARSRVDKTTT